MPTFSPGHAFNSQSPPSPRELGSLQVLEPQQLCLPPGTLLHPPCYPGRSGQGGVISGYFQPLDLTTPG